MASSSLLHRRFFRITFSCLTVQNVGLLSLSDAPLQATHLLVCFTTSFSQKLTMRRPQGKSSSVFALSIYFPIRRLNLLIIKIPVEVSLPGSVLML